jgi:hypothetical protein
MTEAVTLIPPRYEKFIETQMFLYYGQHVFIEIDYEKVELKNDYDQLLRDFKNDIGIDYLIDDDKVVNKYIEENECINETDILDFIKFVKIILEKLYDITHTLKTSKKQVEISLNKKQLKERENSEKRLIKEQRMREIEAVKKQEREAKRLLKEQIELEKQSKKQIIKCTCGIEYIMYNKYNHIKSQDHILRLEGIRYFIKEHGLNFEI